MTKEEILRRMNAIVPNTLMETLSIEFTDVNVEEGWLRVQMPVNSKVHQPEGLLHGGATAAIAESVGSASSLLYIDHENYAVVGIQLSCNHIRGKRDGVVTGTAHLMHKGRTTHLWEIKIEDEEGKLISHCKLTNLVISKKK